MISFLRNNKIAMWILTIARIYLGYQWMMDGVSKLTMKGGFHAEGMIAGAIAKPVQSPNGEAFPWFTSMLKAFTNGGHDASMFNFLVSWGELLVGLGLIFGTLTLAAAFFGMVMNFSYLMAGVVSVNPTFIFIEMFILMAGFNAGRIGLDRWVTPFLRSKLSFLNNDIDVTAK